MSPEEYAGLRRYVGFEGDVSRVLAAIHPVVKPHVEPIIDDFYDAIQRDPMAMSVITGGLEQIKRLKLTLMDWLESGLSGPHDMAWVQRRSRIGMVHVRIGLQQHFMLAAMNRIRSRLVEAIHASALPPDLSAAQAEVAIHRLCNVELAIMLHAYQDYMLERIRAGERLATIGQLAASIGHELRNPLGVIESSMFLTERRLAALGLDDEQLSKHLGKIKRQVESCAVTISSLLDMARDRAPFRKREEISELLRPLLEEKRIEIEVDVPDGLVVYADADDLRLVLSNLFENAREAGARSVRVEARSRDGGTELHVRDDGSACPRSSATAFSMRSSPRRHGVRALGSRCVAVSCTPTAGKWSSCRRSGAPISRIWIRGAVEAEDR